MSVDSNFDGFKKGYSKAASDFGKNVDKELNRIADLMQERASMEAPVDTGYMASHIEKESNAEGSITVVATAGYSGYVDGGTRYMEAQPFFTKNVEKIEAEEFPKIEKNLGLKIEADLAYIRI